MQFTKAGRVWMAVKPTHVDEYRAFATTSRYSAGNNWQTGNKHGLAVNVSWEDAMTFCDWLTDRERAMGHLGAHQHYRLPNSREWDRAAGATAMGGLIWEWCMDPVERNGQYRVLRGGPPPAIPNLSPISLPCHNLGCAARRAADRGFRCVLESFSLMAQN